MHNSLNFKTGTSVGTEPTPYPQVRPRVRPGTGTVPMLRTRLAVAAAFSLTLLPGCGLLCGDRGLFGRTTECLRGGPMMEAIPVSYPVGNGGPCCTPIPAGGPIMAGPTVGGPYGGAPYGGAPIMGGPIYGNGLSETLPPPLAQPGTPRIPKAGIDEGKGKQFELEGASKSGPGGPVLAIPANGTR